NVCPDRCDPRFRTAAPCRNPFSRSPTRAGWYTRAAVRRDPSPRCRGGRPDGPPAQVAEENCHAVHLREGPEVTVEDLGEGVPSRGWVLRPQLGRPTLLDAAAVAHGPGLPRDVVSDPGEPVTRACPTPREPS